ncbi:sialic acid-binding Ig-like lectin 5 [Amia ocellicauda]|uniref:sialic acid-binding Ig-like lectin 5 n=1 Tax=Amia ocellicauda TaxID=2972642 RepID=UPI00346411C8
MRCCYKDRCHFLRRMPAVVFILIFCVTGTQSETTDWPINLPQKLTAEEGLCVIIPCSFSNPENKLQPPFTGIWLKTEQTPQKTVFHSSGPSKVSEEYRGRVALLGNLTENQCTVIISDLRKSDGGTYQFRADGKRKNAKNTYKKKCNIIINDLTQKPTMSPVSVTEGELATLTCTAPGRCSGTPPTITWKTKPDLKGIETHKSENNSDGTTTHSSDFIFWPVPKHNKAVISCEVKFTNTTTQESVTLEVKYSQRKPSVSHSPETVKEGEALTLTCNFYCNPTANVSWTKGGATLSLKENSTELNYTIVNVTHTDAGEYTCIAQDHAKKTVNTSIMVSVHYTPHILNGSGCTTEGDRLTCVCISQGHPLPSIEWREVTVSTDTPLSVSTASTNQSINSTIVLSANATANNSVLCVSSNEMGEVRRQLYGSNTINGSDHWLLLLTHPNTIIGFILGVSAAAFVIFIWCCIACICKRRKKPKLKQEPADQTLDHTLEMVTSIQQVQQDEQTPLQEDKPVASEEPLEVNAGEEKDVSYASIDFARLPGMSSPAETGAEAGGTEYAEVKLKDKNRHEDNTEEQEQDEEHNRTDPTEADSCVYSQIEENKK